MNQMKKYLVIALVLFVKLTTAQPLIIPNIQEWESGKGYFKLSDKSRIIYNEKDFSLLNKDLEQFQKDLQLVSGKELKIEKGEPVKGDIYFSLVNSNKTIGNEGYILTVDKTITVNANTVNGLFYGMQTLLQMFKQNLKIEKGIGIDYPLIGRRGFMIDVARDYFEIEYIEKVIRELAWFKMNFIHVHFTDAEAFRLKSDLFPGLAHPTENYTKEDIRRIQDYAKKYHITLIPEIEMPAHAASLSAYNPYLAFNCPSMRVGHKITEDFENSDQVNWGFTVDITRREVRSWLKTLLDEWIPLFDAPEFHIGGDEWQYDANKYACPELMEAMNKKGYQYPGDVFVEFINEMNAHIKSYGKTTHIWNWWRFSPDAGNTKEIRMNRTSIQPDKDIIIHVWNYPRQQEILNDGYKVIISSEEGPEALYCTPYEGDGKPGDYGVFHTQQIYENWTPKQAENILGYKVCLWTDENNGKPDEWYNPFYKFPLAILAEKTWGKVASQTIEEFKTRYNTVGNGIKK